MIIITVQTPGAMCAKTIERLHSIFVYVANVNYNMAI